MSEEMNRRDALGVAAGLTAGLLSTGTPASPDHPRLDPEEGTPLIPLDRPLAEILGSRHAVHLSERAKQLSWGDLVRLSSWYVPEPDATAETPPPEPPMHLTELTLDDLQSIAEAIEHKTGRRYAAGYMLSCCSCLP
jgi:hypothetical protein